MIFKNTNYKSIISAKGFSLIELLTVLAILGIIASISVVKYKKISRKGKQTEAKTLLSGVYTGERLYYLQDTLKGYTHDLTANGIDLLLEGIYTYNVGFNGITNTAHTTCTNCQNLYDICGLTNSSDDYANATQKCALRASSGTTEVQGLSGSGNTGCQTSGTESFGSLTYGKVKYDTTTSKKGTFYSALACADLKGDKKDVWSINGRKDLVNQEDGTI